jgi:4-amino-4-deoxy-L-arabinose transferase-like glycosyltransferase
VGVLFGLWGIFALYKLISLVWDERRALAGAAVMAVFPGSLFIDREFLPDPGMVSLVTTGCWLAVAYLRFGRRRDLVWSTLAMTAGVLTKLTGLCVVLAIAYAALSIQSGSSQVRRRSLFIAGLAMLVPVALYYAWAWHLSRTYPPYHFAGSQGFIWHSTFATWWAEGYFATGLWQETRNIWTGLGLVLMAVALPLRPAPVRSGAPYFFHWWLLISGGSYFAIGASHLIGQPYNFHLFDPAAAALAGHTVITIANASRRRIGVLASGIVVVALPLAIGLSGLPYLRMVYGSFSSDAYRMGIALRQLSAPTDLVVTIPEYAGDPVAIYYARRHGWVFPPASVWSTIPENWDEVIMQPAAETWLEGLRTEGARWFAIVAAQKERLWRLNPSLADYVDRHFEIRQETEGYTIFQLR